MQKQHLLLLNRLYKPKSLYLYGFPASSANKGFSYRIRISNKSQALPDATKFLLDGIKVVLVSPKTAANVGAVARCCANFEVTNLCVVNPRCDLESGEIAAIACGNYVLDRMTVVSDLEGALVGTTGSIGFTRRAGSSRQTFESVAKLLDSYPDALPSLLPQPTSDVTALVFGREESGLTDDEVRLLSHTAAIPTGRLQPSMNLSHAVSVVLAPLFDQKARSLGVGPIGLDVLPTSAMQDRRLEAADPTELAVLLQKIAQIAEAVGIRVEETTGGGDDSNHGRRIRPMGHIRSILARARINRREVRSLHGFAKAVIAAITNGANRKPGDLES